MRFSFSRVPRNTPSRYCSAVRCHRRSGINFDDGSRTTTGVSGINPDLTAQFDAKGAVTKVTISYPRDFVKHAVVFGTMAFGQTTPLKVNVPFAFSTTAGTLEAGAYTVVVDSNHNGANITSLRNEATNRTVMSIAIQKDITETGSAVVTFRCGEHGCALADIRTSEGTVTYNAGHRSKSDKEVAVVATPVRASTGD